ncbi:MAG: hypothetical protein OEZ15_02715 [Gammaproteobacteria bacterium]|nr:hypothetical protein [Gammaproteobacteria bacterium]
MPDAKNTLLAITELGGYPDFTSLYKHFGYQVLETDNVRKAVKLIRQHLPVVIVAEFNFQSDFRDRTSSLETILSSTQGIIESKMIVFYEQEYQHQYARFLERFEVFASLAFPVDEKELQCVLQRALVE